MSKFFTLPPMVINWSNYYPTKPKSKKAKKCIIIHSIRFDGHRICSLDVEGNVAREIKGPCNKEVKAQHQTGVRECLERHFRLDFAKSADLFNIGLKFVRLRIKQLKDHNLLGFLVDKTSPLFEKGVVDIDNFAEKTKKDQAALKIEEILKKLENQPDIVESVRESLESSLKKEYTLCPYTDRYFRTQDAWIAKAKFLKSLEGEYPELFHQVISDQLIQEIDRIQEKDSNKDVEFATIKSFLADYFTSDQRFEKEDSLTGDAKTQYRSFLIKLGDNFGLVRHPSHFVSILGKTPYGTKLNTIEDLVPILYQKLEFSELEQHLNNLRSFTQISGFQVEVKHIAIQELLTPDPCPHCQNMAQFEKQKFAMQKLEKLAKDLSFNCTMISKQIDTVKNFCKIITSAYQILGERLLKDSDIFDLNSNKIKKPDSDTKFLQDLTKKIGESQKMMAPMNPTVVSTFFKTVGGYVKKIETQHDEAQFLISDFRTIKGKPCSQCKNEDIIDNNRLISMQVTVTQETSIKLGFDELEKSVEGYMDFLKNVEGIKSKITNFLEKSSS